MHVENDVFKPVDVVLKTASSLPLRYKAPHFSYKSGLIMLSAGLYK